MGTNQRKHKKFVRQLTYLIIIGLIFTGVLLYARKLEEHSTHFFVRFENPDKTTSQDYKLEIADSDSERAKGLMFRKSMPLSEGMIFVYPAPVNQSFWMKNTYIPLDMIFVGQNWKVAGVLQNVPISNTEPRSVDKDFMYVIELNAGSAKKGGIVAGSKVEFDGEAPKTKE